MMELSETKLVNLRHHKCEIVCDRTSIFGNPFDYNLLGITRKESCELFEDYFNKKLTNSFFRDKVLALKGKVLGCWCRCLPNCHNPKCKSHQCHVESILRFLNENN